MRIERLRETAARQSRRMRHQHPFARCAGDEPGSWLIRSNRSAALERSVRKSAPCRHLVDAHWVRRHGATSVDRHASQSRASGQKSSADQGRAPPRCLADSTVVFLSPFSLRRRPRPGRQRPSQFRVCELVTAAARIGSPPSLPPRGALGPPRSAPQTHRGTPGFTPPPSRPVGRTAATRLTPAEAPLRTSRHNPASRDRRRLLR